MRNRDIVSDLVDEHRILMSAHLANTISFSDCLRNYRMRGQMTGLELDDSKLLSMGLTRVSWLQRMVKIQTDIVQLSNYTLDEILTIYGGRDD